MKRDYIYIAAIVIVLVFFFIEHQNNSDTLDAVQKDLLFQKEDKRKAFEQFEELMKKKDDSLKAAKDSIKLINQEKKQVETLLARKNKHHETIIFVKYDSDSTRISAVKELYPSFRHYTKGLH